MSDKIKPADDSNAPLDREAAASALIGHLQHATEQQKALLARELHDELGGFLVGAVMDVAWAEQHLTATPAELKQKLLRARQTLASAIDLKRRLIEELRPTLLDNVGLFAALRWHVQAMCNLSEMACTIALPEEELRFLPNVPITLFRIVQEAFAGIVALGTVAATDFSVTLHEESLSIRFVSKPATTAETSGGVEPQALAAVRYRTTILGGAFAYSDLADSIAITATFPLDLLLLPN